MKIILWGHVTIGRLTENGVLIPRNGTNKHCGPNAGGRIIPETVSVEKVKFEIVFY